MAPLRYFCLLLCTVSMAITEGIVEELISKNNNPANVQTKNSPSAEVKHKSIKSENANVQISALEDRKTELNAKTENLVVVENSDTPGKSPASSSSLTSKSPPVHSTGWTPHFPSSSGWTSNTCTYNPDCRATDNNCCKCNQNYAKCCSNYFTNDNEGFCHKNSCKPCKSPGSYCVSSNQCCNSQNPDSQNIITCMNNICCVAPNSAGCVNDGDCCQPLDAFTGYQCVNNYCKPCKKNQQICSSDSDCCGQNSCGYTLSIDGDYDRYGICCVSPAAECRVGVDICCDSRKCSAGTQTNKRYTCIQNRSSKLSDNSLTSDAERVGSGWDERGGWSSQSNNKGGWGNSGGWTFDSIEKVPQIYTLGTCKECVENGSCSISTDCCPGYMCRQGGCTAVPEEFPDTCITVGGSCGSPEDCCDGSPYCSDGICAICSGIYNMCEVTSDCCSGLFCGGIFCIACGVQNDPCETSFSCCEELSCNGTNCVN